MSSWEFEAALRPCPALAAMVVAAHAVVAAVPWLAGCAAWVAGLLSALAMAALVPALRAVPGRTGRVRVLRFSAAGWTVSSVRSATAGVGRLMAGRVLPGIAFCRFLAGGQMLDVWIPRRALPSADFRRLKVAVRCGGPGQDGAAW